ncbi:MAG TPA: hypothetical protein VHA77_04770 [Xanthobacteraceae bacterium]|nr:hypothetical protein [Xanthobacteraceae bacterium]
MAELERALARGDEMPGADLVLQELRRTLRGTSRLAEQMGPAAGLFLAPLEPFLVDDGAEHVHPGRVSQAGIRPIWDWICRDVLPEEAKAYTAEITRLTAENETGKAEQAARAFQDRAVQQIRHVLATLQADDRARRRMAAQIGTPHAITDAGRVLSILSARDGLATIASRLPMSIRNLSEDQLDGVKALLDSQAGRPDTFLCAVVMTMNRLVAPWQLIRLATKAAESDKASRVADGPYAVAVTIVLAELERLVRALKRDLKRGRAAEVGPLLKDIHDTARGLRTEMDLGMDSPWARQLAAVRSEVAELLKSEIESMPGRVRRLLRPRPVKEIAPGSALDSGDVAETEALIEFVGVCRNYANELAINEMTLRTYSEVQHYLDTGTSALLDALRTAGESDRNFRQSQVDAAVRFCAKVFGKEYASLLAKAADVAANSERKAAAKA